MLPDLDSNQDKRYQKPSYYLYTIGQSPTQKRPFELVCKYRAIKLDVQKYFVFLISPGLTNPKKC